MSNIDFSVIADTPEVTAELFQLIKPFERDYGHRVQVQEPASGHGRLCSPSFIPGSEELDAYSDNQRRRRHGPAPVPCHSRRPLPGLTGCRGADPVSADTGELPGNRDLCRRAEARRDSWPDPDRDPLCAWPR